MDCFACFQSLTRALRVGDVAAAKADSDQSGFSPLEHAVAVEWERVLGLPTGTVCLTDSFVELGGESLLALRVCQGTQCVLSGSLRSKDAEDGDFGMVTGPFAVTELLQAQSLGDYCGHLRRHGYSMPKAAVEEPARGEEAAHEESLWGRSGDGSMSWPQLRRSIHEKKQGQAAVELKALLAGASQAKVAHWCGLPVRGEARLEKGKARASHFNALHAAAYAGSADCVRLLLEKRAKLTATEGGSQLTAAHYGAISSASCLRLLLAAKAPLTVRDARGQSLLHAAARSGNAESLRCLMEYVKEQQDKGNKAPRAFRAGEGGSHGFLEWTDRWQRTAVHWATLNGHADVLAALLEYGANPKPALISESQMSKRTHMTQETPLDIARRLHGEDSPIMKILLAATSENGKSEDNAQAANEREVDERHRYLITIAEPRLEKLAVWELQERLQANVQRNKCRMFFSTASLPSVFFGLKAAEKICTVVLHATGDVLASFAEVRAGTGEGETLERQAAQWIFREASWDASLRRWKEFHGLPLQGDDVTFKITCRRKGERFKHVSSQALAVALASVLTRSKGWRAQVRRPDLEIRVLIGDQDLLVDFPLLYQGCVRHGGGEIAEAGLSQAVAWAMGRSAELLPGDSVLDPMCGRAVILVEAAMSWPKCRFGTGPTLQGASPNCHVLPCLLWMITLPKYSPFPLSEYKLTCTPLLSRGNSSQDEVKNIE
eukprot:TRINITY_DN25962_c0_g1_i2.p1 TRINITY_DN25962_c0_g1~~TRINITY_DN25962_c0_g1_i2.p1  ORF type:complete len:720 (+),score=89.56 TRINITY_DN25962_c0_g1_i2:68-2227(+)